MISGHNRLEKLAAGAQSYYAKNRSAHQWDHIMRVSVTAEKIAKTEQNVDMELLYAMVYLHDIVRYEDERENRSVEESIKLARTLLSELGYSPTFIEAAVAGIASHSLHQAKITPPGSIEAKILFDADKIDGVGPIGIARWLMVESNKNKKIKDAAGLYLKSVKKQSTGSRILFTGEGNNLLQEKLTYAKNFFEVLLAELSLA